MARKDKDIEKKIIQVRFRHLKKALRTGLSRRPENCAYNAKLGQGNKPNTPKIGVCMYGVNQDVIGTGPRGVCDECFGGRNRASDCGEFEPLRDAADIRKDFDGFLNTASKGEIAYHYPDLAALLWALGDHPDLDSIIPDDDMPQAQVEEVEQEAVATEAEAELLVVQPWWSVWLEWVRGLFRG